jgi:hypothetical protein
VEKEIPSSEKLDDINVKKSGSGMGFEVKAGVDLLGNIYIAGNDYHDIYLACCNNSGELQWNTTWGGPDTEYMYDLFVDDTGMTFITGSTDSYGKGSADLFLICFNSTGQLLWNVTWGGKNYDVGNSIIGDTSENIYITGRTRSFDVGSGDLILNCYNYSGNLKWNQSFGTVYDEYGSEIALDNSGNIFIAGAQEFWDDKGSQILLIKYSSTGVEKWHKTWGGNEWDLSEGVAVDNTGDVLVPGYNRDLETGETMLFLTRFNSSGELKWNLNWGANEYDMIKDIAINQLNEAYITGLRVNSSSNDFNTRNSAFLAQYNSSGTLLWNHTFGINSSTEATGLDIDQLSKVYVTGFSAFYPLNENYSINSIILRCYNHSGDLLWDVKLNTKKQFFPEIPHHDFFGIPGFPIGFMSISLLGMISLIIKLIKKETIITKFM